MTRPDLPVDETVDEPIPAPAGAEVAVLVREHRRLGAGVQVFGSYDAARAARAAIARAGWAALAAQVAELPAAAPVDDEEAAETYFAHHADEDASIRIQRVAPDPAAPPAPSNAAVADPALAGLLAALATLDDVRAHAVLHTVATGRCWPYAVWDASDVTDALLGHDDWDFARELTGAQWTAVTGTRAWGEIADVAQQGVVVDDVVDRVIRQAGLVCVDCAALLDAPLTATWGRCTPCRAGRPLPDLQDDACPADERSHDWSGPACLGCGLPAPDRVVCAGCRRQVPLRSARREHGYWFGEGCAPAGPRCTCP